MVSENNWQTNGICIIKVVNNPDWRIEVNNDKNSFTSIISRELIGRKDSDTFYQWKDPLNRYGLKFTSTTDASNFINLIESTLVQIRSESPAIRKRGNTTGRPNSPVASSINNLDNSDLSSQSVWPGLPPELLKSKKSNFSIGIRRPSVSDEIMEAKDSLLGKSCEIQQDSGNLEEATRKIDELSVNNEINLSPEKGEWREATTPEGKRYYYNTVTRQTKWTIPEASQRFRSITSNDVLTSPASIENQKLRSFTSSPTIPIKTQQPEQKSPEPKVEQKTSVLLKNPIII